MVLAEKKPVLGICVGMQMMAKNSEEGNSEGLGWFDAHVKCFDEEQLHDCKHLPHMGWNDVEPVKESGLFKGLNDSARFYFLHSYYFYPKFSTDITAFTEYGGNFACAVQRENIYGVQFHLKKSLLKYSTFKSFAFLMLTNYTLFVNSQWWTCQDGRFMIKICGDPLNAVQYLMKKC